MMFGVVHALMPGHGKTVLFSYHLGQKGSLASSIANGAILALTHVGIAIVLILAGFAVISKAFAYGGRTPQFEMASSALIVLIGAFLLWRASAFAHEHAPSGNGRVLAFVTGLVPCPLTTFIMAYALARGLLGVGLVVIAAMAAGMVVTIAAVAVTATVSRERLMAFFARTEGLLERLGRRAGNRQRRLGSDVRRLADSSGASHLTRLSYPPSSSLSVAIIRLSPSFSGSIAASFSA
jgi:ABC-type nickel/cobalt efflux system permease component RcnA